MGTLRIILIILGLIVIALIYFWEKHKNKLKMDKQVVHLPEEDDEPGVMISIRKDNDEDIYTDLADLRGFMDERNLPETDMHTSEDKLSGVSDEDNGEDESDLIEEGPEQNTSEQEIITLHIIAREGDVISGESLQRSAESNGLEFGEMEIFHFKSTKERGDTAPILFSLVNMYEPGVFEIEKMSDFKTRGISLFASPGRGRKALETFDVMLDTARKMADELDARLCGPDRQSLDNKAINQIRLRLDKDN